MYLPFFWRPYPVSQFLEKLFVLPRAADAGFRLIDDAQILWDAFLKPHDKAGFAGASEIPMESFIRAVEIMLKESELLDSA